MRSIEAKWNSVCSRCHKRIVKGVDQVSPLRVEGYKKSRWVHSSCAAGAPEVSPSPVEANGAPAAVEAPTVTPETAPVAPVEPVKAPTGSLEARVTQIAMGVAEKALAGFRPANLESPITTVEIKGPSPEDVKKMTGIFHKAFGVVLQLCAARRNVLLIGPSGCGKTHLAEQVAEALELSFAHVSCTVGMSEGHLRGRLLPTGEAGRFEYQRSDFIRAYEEGGVFLLDELDAADPNVLLCVNSALANGYMPIPERVSEPSAKRHPDFVLLAAANTYGTGSDRLYVGRCQLDEATLDRFRIGQVPMDYDPRVEKAICPDNALRERLTAYREKVEGAGLRRIVSSRFMRDAYTMKQAGWTDKQIDGALFSGWSKDEISKVK